RTGARLGEIAAHSLPTKCISFHPRNDLLASGSDDQSIKLWDLGGRQCLKTIRGHPNAIRGVAWRPGTSELVSGGEDGKVHFWRRGINGLRYTGVREGHPD